MCRLDPYVRLTANNSGETKCVIFVDSCETARKHLEKFTNTIVAAYPFISGFGAHISVHQINDLAQLPCVKAISSHSNVATCMDNAKVDIGANHFYNNDYYGEGVTVVVIDTGVRSHMDFMMPVKRMMFVDLINGEVAPYDDNGHGTAVSSILCGNGLLSGGKFSGIAPKCNLIVVKAIGKDGEGGAFTILEAMQWVYNNKRKYNIGVVCMSFGSNPIYDGVDPLAIGAEALWRSGVVVVASAGNDGPMPETIKSPGCSPYIITVGGAYFEKGKIKIADFSSRGPAGMFVKPDIVAPSVDVSCCGSISNYVKLSGTSMAAPIVAGAVALLLEKNPRFTPDKIKEVLLNDATLTEFDANIAGRGFLNLNNI